MMLLSLVAFAVFAATFGAVGFALRTSPEQRRMQSRLESLVVRDAAPRSVQVASAVLRDAPVPTSEGWAVRLQQAPWLRTLEQLVYQSTGQRSVLPTLLWVAGAGAAGCIAVDALTGMLPIAALSGALLGAVPLVRLHLLRRKRIRQFESALPDCIDMCARALRAGHSLVAAIGMVAEQAPEPARTEFASLFNKQNYGLPIRDALLETLERLPSPDFRVFATGILVQKDTGGNLTNIFDRIVFVIRERLRIQGEIRVHTAQGRMTAWILTLLPLMLLLVINLINPGYSRPLFSDPVGKKLLYLGVVLLIAGGYTVRRIVNGIEV